MCTYHPFDSFKAEFPIFEAEEMASYVELLPVVIKEVISGYVDDLTFLCPREISEELALDIIDECDDADLKDSVLFLEYLSKAMNGECLSVIAQVYDELNNVLSRDEQDMPLFVMVKVYCVKYGYPIARWPSPSW